eukprot:GEMP01026221.1.p1 GENE.GEMP01026221.1~~GEMP01026221.1.p1  ORF type:complete len:659 (+),score=187.35 GEMP01026221.1:72-2048(+)
MRRERLRNFKPSVISTIPKVGESVFAKVGRMLPTGDAEIPLRFQKIPKTMLGTNMVPGEVVELRASTVKKKSKRAFDAELYVHDVCNVTSSASSSCFAWGGDRKFTETVASPWLSREKQCVHNVLGHCNGCLFPRVAYGRQLVEKRRWLQNGWGMDPGKVRPGLQHGCDFTMEWRGYINKGPRGWSGTGWPTECTRISRRARAAMGTAVDHFPEAHRYHIVQGDANDVLLVLEGGLSKCGDGVKERMQDTLLRVCDGIMWDGEHIGGKNTVTLHLALHKTPSHQEQDQGKCGVATIPTHTLDVATHVYIPARSILSEVCRALIYMVPADVQCAWETGVPPFAVSLSTACDHVVHFGPHVSALKNEKHSALEEKDEHRAVEENGDNEENENNITSLLCDWHQEATLRRLLLLCAKEVEQHADEVALGQYDLVEEQRAKRLFGEEGLVAVATRDEKESGGSSLDEKNKARLQKLYRGLAKKYHPDREGGDSQKFAELARAYTDLMNDDEGGEDSDDEAHEVSGMLTGESLASPVVYADNQEKSPGMLMAPDLVVWTLQNGVKPQTFRTWLRKGLVVKHIIIVFDGPFEFLRKTVLALGHSGYVLDDVRAFDSGPHTPSFTTLARLRFNPVGRDKTTPGQLRIAFKENRPIAWTMRIADKH